MQQVRAFVAANAIALVAAAAIVLVGVFGGLVFGSLLASRGGPAAVANPTLGPDPTVRPRPPTPTPAPKPTPTPRPTPSPTPTPTLIPNEQPTGSGPLEPIAIPGSDPDVIAAIEASAAGLLATERFRFASGVSGRDLRNLVSDPLFDIGMRGTLVRVPDFSFEAVVGTSLVEPGGVAAVSQSIQVIVIGDTAWAPRPNETPKPEPLGPDTLANILLFMPDAILERVFVPFAAGYEVVGNEAKSGVDAIHYRATAAGREAYAKVLDVVGTCEADVWLARDNGLAVAGKILCEPADRNSKVRGFYAEFEITDAGDDGIVIKPPS